MQYAKKARRFFRACDSSVDALRRIDDVAANSRAARSLNCEQRSLCRIVGVASADAPSLGAHAIAAAGFVVVPSQGGPVKLSHHVGLTDDFPFHHPVLEVVNGTSYQVFLTAGLDFTAEPFVVPPAPNDQSSFSFSTPMTMTGNITGWGAWRREPHERSSACGE